MNNNLLILGAGGHGRVVKETAEAMGVFGKISFLDDNFELALGKLSDADKFIEDFKYAFSAFGANIFRMNWLTKLREMGYTIPVLIHPSTYISPSATIGAGTIVEPLAIVNTNSIIEEGSIIGLGTIIDHDSKIEAGCHLNCGTIVKSHTLVKELLKIESGSIVER